MTGEAFWDSVDAELADVPMAAELRPIAERALPDSTLYLVRLTSIGPYRISAYYSVPNRPGPHSGLLLTPRYGSVNHAPDFHDRARYAVVQLIHRGQRLADKPFAAEYPGLLTLGIDAAESYVYRAIVADCLRGWEFLRAQPDVGSIAIQGDDLALITAARRPDTAAVLAESLMLYRLLDQADRSDAYPAEEINDYLRAHAERRAAVAETLAYFDPRAHVRRIRAAAMLPSGDDVEWLGPLRAAFGAECAEYRLTHRGQDDHEHLDAWLAGKLGAEPRSRFLQPA
jgi:cephalosporin-C deacetylase